MSTVPLASSGWKYLTDRDMVEVIMSGKHLSGQIRLFDFGNEMKRRGMMMKMCSECDEPKVHYAHDYICILCRASGS